MHSSRMSTAHCNGCFSCQKCPHPLPCMPPVMHTPCHTCPLPHMPPTMHASCHACPLPCTPPRHTHPTTHAPRHACPPAMHAPSHACPHCHACPFLPRSPHPAIQAPPATHIVIFGCYWWLGKESTGRLD